MIYLIERRHLEASRVSWERTNQWFTWLRHDILKPVQYLESELTNDLPDWETTSWSQYSILRANCWCPTTVECMTRTSRGLLPRRDVFFCNSSVWQCVTLKCDNVWHWNVTMCDTEVCRISCHDTWMGLWHVIVFVFAEWIDDAQIEACIKMMYRSKRSD